ncbi:MAG: TIGR04552 family protein [Methylotenera sp.]|nr:TIGR04552 family protein [Oligoflexia bacterium]
MAENQTLDSLRKKFGFRFEVLDIIINGRSSIDSAHGFNTETLADADRFLKSYGFDLENPIEGAEVFGHFHEALNFIRRYFLQPENPEGLKLEVPRKILELTNVRDLFLMASLTYPGQSPDTQGQLLRNWACSLLKVMHTIAHVDQDLRSSYFSDIQKQIFDRFYKLIHRDEDGRLFLGERHDDPNRVDLAAFETKPKKSRDSTLLKLLHKPENVAEDIFDRVGIRFVTVNRLGALQIVKYLADSMIVMAPNIKPSRSRNTLIDLEAFRARLTDTLLLSERKEMSAEAFMAELEEAAHPPFVNPENPHTSEFYRAIQFTCRQLIKLQNPLYNDLKELKALAKAGPLSEDVGKIVERVDLKYLQKEVRFFYPFEVQIVDEKSAEENEKGRSAHSEYKKAQILTAMKRVMGSLVDAVR